MLTDELRALAEPLAGPTLQRLAGLARRQGHLTVCGWPEAAGDRLAVFDTSLGPTGVAICYDLEFPEVAGRQDDVLVGLIDLTGTPPDGAPSRYLSNGRPDLDRRLAN